MRKSATKTHEAQGVSDQLERFVHDLLVELDRYVDKRLVRTFLLALQAIIKFRHSSQGLLLSELGGLPGRTRASASRDETLEQLAAVAALELSTDRDVSVAASRPASDGVVGGGATCTGSMG